MSKTILIVVCCLCSAVTSSQEAKAQIAAAGDYVIGIGDEISVWVLGAEEMSTRPHRVSTSGRLDLPMAGVIPAAGMTMDGLKAELIRRLQDYLRDPKVSLSVTDYQSQPVSVMGAVNKPGVHQLKGRKTLVEVLALAEGIHPDAGGTLRVTRRTSSGSLPLAGAVTDPAGDFSMASINLKSITQGLDPAANLAIRPHDTIFVARAKTIYVLGEVKKPGGFLMTDRENVSVMEALALAEGLSRLAKSKDARILRVTKEGGARYELPVNLAELMQGRGEDLRLQPDDILFVPNNQAKNAVLRAAETALSIGTGITIWRVGLPR